MRVFYYSKHNDINKGNDKEEYHLTLKRESNSSAERLLKGRNWEGSFGTGFLKGMLEL